MKKAALFTLIITLLASVALAATWMPTTTKQEILEGAINQGDTFMIAFYDSSATCDATFNSSAGTYTATNEVGTAGGYSLGTLTTAIDTTTAYVSEFSADADHDNVITLSSVTFAGAVCGIIYDATHASDQILVGFTMTSISPSAEDVTITFPADGASTAIVRIN